MIRELRYSDRGIVSTSLTPDLTNSLPRFIHLDSKFK